MTPLSVVVVGSSPWSDDLSDDDLDLRVARATADRLGGRYDVIVPSGASGPGRLDRRPVFLHRVAARSRPGFVLAAQRALDRLVTTGPQAPIPQVLMSSDPLAALAVESSRARRRLPHIVHLQGEVLAPGLEYGGRLKRWALGAVSRSAVRRASSVRVVSENLRAAATPLTSRPVVFIGSRVDTGTFTPRPPGERPDVAAIMVGGLNPCKNHDTVVRAWSQVVRTSPTARLVIVGDGPGRARLEALVHELGLRRHVRLAGRVPHREIAPLLRAAAVLLHSSWSEGQPRAVLEGMACGLPVVCSDIPAHRELVPDGAGRLVPPGDTGRWAEETTALLAEPARAAEMGRLGRAFVALRHDFDGNLDRMAELIRNTVPARQNRTRTS